MKQPSYPPSGKPRGFGSKPSPSFRRGASAEPPADPSPFSNNPSNRVPTRSSDPRMPMPKIGSDPRLSKASDARIPRGADVRSAPARGTPSPFLVRGEVPHEPILVSIITTSQDALQYTHAFVAAYCRHRFRLAVAEGLTVAAHELLENAINYGSVSGQVLFEIVERTGSVAVRVTNETIQARIEMLRSHIEKLSTNPELVIVEEMRRSMGATRTRPMLGLARVVQEAGLGLELYVTGGRVTVLARAST